MRFTSLILTSLVAAWANAGLEQERLVPSAIPAPDLNERQEYILQRLRLAEIIPTVVDDFVPLVEVSASWSHKTNASMGNTLKPKKLKHAPSVSLTPLTAPSTSEYRQFVAVLTDPDAKARDDPVWAEFAHWIAYWPTEGKKIDVLGYKPPAPPKRTWKHRYVMVVLTPVNGTTDRLSLAEPKGRKRWGYEGVREGVRRWAGENGLGVVGVNWVMAMDRKQ